MIVKLDLEDQGTTEAAKLEEGLGCRLSDDKVVSSKKRSLEVARMRVAKIVKVVRLGRSEVRNKCNHESEYDEGVR